MNAQQQRPHDPTSYSISAQYDQMRGCFVVIGSEPIYNLPCDICLPLWRRTAKRERGNSRKGIQTC